MKWVQDPLVFITYCFWKILRTPGLQINQVIFDAMINPSITFSRTVPSQNPSVSDPHCAA
jgi:hypothetical protein